MKNMLLSIVLVLGAGTVFGAANTGLEIVNLTPDAIELVYTKRDPRLRSSETLAAGSTFTLQGETNVPRIKTKHGYVSEIPNVNDARTILIESAERFSTKVAVYHTGSNEPTRHNLVPVREPDFAPKEESNLGNYVGRIYNVNGGFSTINP